LTQESIRYFLSRDYPVYLEGFGILFPRARSSNRTYQKDTQLLVRNEHYRTIEFEKCSAPSKFHRDTYLGMKELKSLSERVYALLPIELAYRTTEKEVRGQIAALVAELTKEIVVEGTSNFFSTLGVFYALHNRQGDRFEDWFAGSDIFLSAHFSEPTTVGNCMQRERPVLESSWELLEAAYGRALLKTTIDLPEELKSLGYDVSILPQDVERLVPVAVFQAYAEKEKTYYLIYCTDGLRFQGLKSQKSKGYGTELVLQLPISTPFKANDQIQLKELPLWPFRPLTMGWIMMQGSSARVLRSGLKMAEDHSLIPDFDSDLSCVLITPFKAATEEQLSTQGSFYFVNILGITRDEFDFADKVGCEHLKIILEYKKLSQFTKPIRSSLISRSSFQQKKNVHKSSNILVDPRLSTALESTRSSVPA
jgi:Suppressor of fused protein (SUFU)